MALVPPRLHLLMALAAVATVVEVAVTPIGQAQMPASRPDSTSGAPGDTAVLAVPEILVTGRTGRESLQSTPAAVTIVPRGRFADKSGLSLKDGLTLVPGVLAQSRSGSQDLRIMIRGYGARGSGERSNSGVSRGIRIMTDGIPVSEPDGRTAFDLTDLGSVDRIEVQRSNASALYGNASGGVIDLQSRLDFNKPYLTLRSRGGSYGAFKQQLQVGGVLDQTRIMTSLTGTRFGGWREHSGTQSLLLQSRLKTPLTDETDLELLLDGTVDEFHYPGALTEAEADSAPEQANPTYVRRNERRQNQVGRVAMKLKHEISESQDLSATLFVEPKMLHRSERNRFRDFNRVHVGGSLLWQTAIHPSKNTTGHIGAGFDEAWQDGAILFYDLTPEGNRGTTLKANQREGANSAGAFLQGDLTIAKVWQARASIRYDDVWFISENRMEPLLNDDKSFSHWTPRFTLGRAIGRQNIYAAIAGGLESPAFNEIDPPAPYDTLTSLNPFLDPTYSTTWELGLRGRAAEGLNYDVAGYWIELTNDLVPFDGGSYFETAGKGRRQGIEGSLDWKPAQRWAFLFSGSVSRNEYVDYANDRGDFSGNQMAPLPKWFGSSTLEFRITPTLKLNGGVEAVGPLFADDANTQEVDGWAIGNIGADWTTVVGSTLLHLFGTVQNVTDQAYTASVFINGSDGRYIEPGLPRNLSVGLTLGW